MRYAYLNKTKTTAETHKIISVINKIRINYLSQPFLSTLKQKKKKK